MCVFERHAVLVASRGVELYADCADRVSCNLFQGSCVAGHTLRSSPGLRVGTRSTCFMESSEVGVLVRVRLSRVPTELQAV